MHIFNKQELLIICEERNIAYSPADKLGDLRDKIDLTSIERGEYERRFKWPKAKLALHEYAAAEIATDNKFILMLRQMPPIFNTIEKYCGRQIIKLIFSCRAAISLCRKSYIFTKRQKYSDVKNLALVNYFKYLAMLGEEVFRFDSPNLTKIHCYRDKDRFVIDLANSTQLSKIIHYYVIYNRDFDKLPNLTSAFIIKKPNMTPRPQLESAQSYTIDDVFPDIFPNITRLSLGVFVMGAEKYVAKLKKLQYLRISHVKYGFKQDDASSKNGQAAIDFGGLTLRELHILYNYISIAAWPNGLKRLTIMRVDGDLPAIPSTVTHLTTILPLVYSQLKRTNVVTLNISNAEYARNIADIYPPTLKYVQLRGKGKTEIGPRTKAPPNLIATYHWKKDIRKKFAFD